MSDLISSVISVLSLSPARWTALCAAIPEDLLRRAPAPGEWSAVECLIHLLDTEKNVFPVRVKAFLAGHRFPGFNPDAQGAKGPEKTPDELAVEFARYRAQTLQILRKLTAADLPRVARHGELGAVTLAQMLNEWAAHDLMHTVQAERAMMQPFIGECGPWRNYFSDHDVAVKK